MVNESESSSEVVTPSADIPIQVRQSDLEPEMEAFSLELARQVFADDALKSGSLRGLAGAVKKAMDERYGPNWHCVIGRSFGSFVTHGMN